MGDIKNVLQEQQGPENHQDVIIKENYNKATDDDLSEPCKCQGLAVPQLNKLRLMVEEKMHIQ